MYNGDFTRCAPGDVNILGYTTSLRVVGKGEISVSVAVAPCLLADIPALNATQSFTVTGGTGIYAGASVSGRIERFASFEAGCDIEDRACSKGREESPRHVQSDGERQRGRSSARYLRSPLRQSIHGGSVVRQVLGERFERKHGECIVQGHGETEPVTGV